MSPFKFKRQFWIFAISNRPYLAVPGWHHIVGRLWIKGREGRPPVRCCSPLDLLWDAFTFREFEPESWRDYWIVPASLLKWSWAWIFWRFILVLTRVFHHYPLARVWTGVSPNSRWSSPEPTICPRCLWAGQRRQCVHGYTEWEAEDECPRCGKDI